MRNEPQLPMIAFIKFCVVGVTGVFIDMFVLFLFADPRCLHLNLTFSKIVAAELALGNNFLWNELWTFRRSAKSRPGLANVLRRFLLFNAICGIGIGLAVLLLHTFHTWLGLNVYLSNLIAIIMVTVWNFGMNSKFNWALPQP